ncbi:MAG: YigZ family protein [Candidatus Limiplasma sp.]|nr:YigZ family protein [Candidatus Limiplasma sp.]
MNPYKTLLAEKTAEYLVQKSRFLGLATPVQTEEEALALLRRVREEHRAANHRCYAYILGQNAGVMRYSDDGEPGGTAGMPILEVLRARGVVNCAVVVTRYFGGILLGAGGLTRAYSHSCALAVEAAGVCEMLPTQRWLCEVAYPLWDRVQHALRGLPVRLENTVFTTSVQFELLTRTVDADALLDTLARVTDGRAETLMLEELYQPWPETAGQEA